MDVTASPSSDRAGRILVRLGGLAAVVFVALPTFLFALVTLFLADSSTTVEGQTFVAALIAFAIVTVVTVVMMLRGSPVWLALGGLGSLVAGSAALALISQQGGEWFVLLGQALLVAVSAFALALGAALRLLDRRRAGVGG
jgi:hypothetical protein